MATDSLRFESIDLFTSMGGQLRVSLTPECNLRCWFCHNEGDVPPVALVLDSSLTSRPKELGIDDYIEVVRAALDAGVRRLFFTGGEPLMSPVARPLLESIPRHDKSEFTTALITNGTLFRRNIAWLRDTALDKIKISMHYFSDSTFRSIAGTRASVRPVVEAVDLALENFAEVELNVLVQEQNRAEIPLIVEFAKQRGIGVQLIGLVETSFNGGAPSSRDWVAELAPWLSTLAVSERAGGRDVGQRQRVFDLGGSTVELIDGQLGRQMGPVCQECSLRTCCTEGFWALRLDQAGFLSPCLLRGDLRVDVRPFLGAEHGVAKAMDAALAPFVEVGL